MAMVLDELAPIEAVAESASRGGSKLVETKAMNLNQAKRGRIQPIFH